jgi:hypothetical protein
MAGKGPWDTLSEIESDIADNASDIGNLEAFDTALPSTPQEWTGQQNFNEVALSSASNSVAWDLDLAQVAVHVLTEATDFAAPTNMNAGGTYLVRIVQAAGVYAITWDAAFDFGAESDPALPAANGDLIIVSFYSDGSVMYGVEVLRKEA